MNSSDKKSEQEKPNFNELLDQSVQENQYMNFNELSMPDLDIAREMRIMTLLQRKHTLDQEGGFYRKSLGVFDEIEPMDQAAFRMEEAAFKKKYESYLTHNRDFDFKRMKSDIEQKNKDSGIESINDDAKDILLARRLISMGRLQLSKDQALDFYEERLRFQEVENSVYKQIFNMNQDILRFMRF